MEGKVKWFNREKGFGFITSWDAKDHYYNVRSVKGADLPYEGDKVTFDSEMGNKGLKALNVEIIEKASEKKHSDDPRLVCLGCGKKIVPRMITNRGKPEKSVCPYCAYTVKSFSNCFIATSVYGDPSCDEVRALRKFRDERLLTNPFGRAFVKIYYRSSPQIAEWLKSKPKLSCAIRSGLDKLVRWVK